MATRFITKALSATALGIALSLLLAATTTTSSASSNTAGALQLDPPAALSNCRSNLFEGSWSGTYLSSTEPPLSGTIDWTVSNGGQITGTFYNPNAPNNYPGTVDGHVNVNGNLVLRFRKPCLACVWLFQGTAVIDGEGNLVATYSNPWPVSQGGYTEVAILERN